MLNINKMKYNYDYNSKPAKQQSHMYKITMAINSKVPCDFTCDFAVLLVCYYSHQLYFILFIFNINGSVRVT
jgi:hypothetical protein